MVFNSIGIKQTGRPNPCWERPACCNTKTGCSIIQQLFKFFFPAGAGDPFFVDLVIEAVALGLSQEIVQIVQKIGIALVDGPGQRFVGERVA